MAKVFIQEDGGGDYTSLEDAVAVNETDIEIQETWDYAEDAHITIDDAGTVIEATGSAKFPGYIPGSPSHYRIRPTDSGHTFTISASASFKGMEVKRVGAAGDSSDECFRQPEDLTLIECLIWMDDGLSNEDDADGIYMDGGSGETLNIINCIFLNFGRSGIQVADYEITVNINSSVIYNTGGYDSGNEGACIRARYCEGDINIFNSLLFAHPDASGDLIEISATPTWDIHNCIGSDGTIDTYDSGAYGCLVNHNITDDNTKDSDGDWVIVEDITTEPYDMRLQSNTYNEAQDMHTDTSGAGLSMPDADIVGTSRPQNTNYDAGAFEIVAGWVGKVLGVDSPAKVIGVSDPAKVMGV